MNGILLFFAFIAMILGFFVFKKLIQMNLGALGMAVMVTYSMIVILLFAIGIKEEFPA